MSWKLVGPLCLPGRWHLAHDICRMFGYNVGNIGGCIVLPSFHAQFHLPEMGTSAYNNVSSNIISMLQIGALVGSLGAFPLMKTWGRKVTLAAAAAVYLVGAVLQTFSYGSLDKLYVGRVITGLGAGAVTVVVPLVSRYLLNHY